MLDVVFHRLLDSLQLDADRPCSIQITASFLGRFGVITPIGASGTGEVLVRLDGQYLLQIRANAAGGPPCRTTRRRDRAGQFRAPRRAPA